MKRAKRLAILGATVALAMVGHAAPSLAQSKPAGQAHYVIGKPYQFDGVWYEPAVDLHYDQVGIASFYPPGRKVPGTTSGEAYDENAIAGAHKTLPLPSVVKVTNLANGKAITLRLNDRGPFVDDRIIELTPAAARALGAEGHASLQVRVQIMARESQAIATALGGNDMGPQPAMPIAPNPAPSVKVTALPLLNAPAIQPMKPVAEPGTTKPVTFASPAAVATAAVPAGTPSSTTTLTVPAATPPAAPASVAPAPAPPAQANPPPVPPPATAAALTPPALSPNPPLPTAAPVAASPAPAPAASETTPPAAPAQTAAAPAPEAPALTASQPAAASAAVPPPAPPSAAAASAMASTFNSETPKTPAIPMPEPLAPGAPPPQAAAPASAPSVAIPPAAAPSTPPAASVPTVSASTTNSTAPAGSAPETVQATGGSPGAAATAIPPAPTPPPASAAPAQTASAAPAPAAAPAAQPAIVLSSAPAPVDQSKVKPLPLDLPAQFFIQTGAFKAAADADALRGKLASLGPSKVVPTRLGIDKYNAVLIGPIATMGDAQRLLKQINGMGYADAVLIIQ